MIDIVDILASIELSLILFLWAYMIASAIEDIRKGKL